MTFKVFISVFLLTTIALSCNKEYNCSYVQIQPAFIGFNGSDIDTFVLRKFTANGNYQNLIDTFIVNGDYSAYRISNDTATVFVGDLTNDGKAGILFGYDWQIFIPSTNQAFTVSEIVSEKNTGKCGGLDKFNCTCTNKNFSTKYDNQTITFSNSLSDSGRYYLYIHR